MSIKLKQRAGWKAANTKIFGMDTKKDGVGSFKISADAELERNHDEDIREETDDRASNIIKIR